VHAEKAGVSSASEVRAVFPRKDYVRRLALCFYTSLHPLTSRACQ